MKINSTLCEPEPLPDPEIKSIWNSAVNFHNKIRKESSNFCNSFLSSNTSTKSKTTGNNTPYTQNTHKIDREELVLAQTKLTKQDKEFVLNAIKKEAPYDELSIKQLFYGMSSAFTKLPIPHIVNSKDSGAGKSYLLNLVASYFTRLPDNIRDFDTVTSQTLQGKVW
jgi:hypothetical protein